MPSEAQGVLVAEGAQPIAEPDPHPVPPGMRATAAWAWRFLVVAAAAFVLLYLVGLLKIVILPFVAALLLTAALVPVTHWLRRRGVGQGPAAALTILGSLVLVGGLLALVGNQVVNGIPEVSARAGEGIGEVRDWLVNLGVPATQLDNLGAQLSDLVSQNRDRLTTGAITTATLAVEVVTGLLLAFFSFIFLLYDGEGVWRWLVRLVPQRGRHRVDVAGRRAWVTLTGYVRGTVLVAAVDAVFIGIILLVLRVEFAIPLAVIVFFGAFIPLVGATLSATLAALVALVTQGPIVALLVIAGIILVQQLEGHVLQPFLLGRFVRLHPLAVVLAIGAGTVIAGIPGALVAVPLAAVANTVGLYLSGRVPDEEGAQASEVEEQTGDRMSDERRPAGEAAPGAGRAPQ